MKLFELYRTRPLREDKTLTAAINLCESVVAVLESWNVSEADYEGGIDFEPDAEFAGVKGVSRDSGVGNKAAADAKQKKQQQALNKTWIGLIQKLKMMNPDQARTMKVNMKKVAQVAKQKGFELSPSPEQVLGLAIESVVEDEAQEYGVYSKGGSIGKKSDKPVATFDNKADAMAKAKSMRKGLSKGEREYYKMGYVVRPIK